MNPPPAPRPELGGTSNAERLDLRAGALRLIFDHGDLRYIQLGDREVIRRIYAAVRDRNWDTIPAAIRNLQVDSGSDFFHITYESEHTRDEIAFVWTAEITGDSSGTIRFVFDGEARSTFLKNRIGLCVLHPLTCAGQPCTVHRADGTKIQTTLPKLVAPEQPVKEVFNLGSITHHVAPGISADVSFEGDLFEMEDQRNWIDASFKIYSTPLTVPFPVEIRKGTRVRQTVTLELNGDIASPPVLTSTQDDIVRLDLDFSRTLPRAPIGLSVSSFRERYSQSISKLKALNLAHLRADLSLDATNWQDLLAHATWEANAIGVPLELALTIPPASNAKTLAPLLRWATENRCLIKRWIIFTQDAPSTNAETVALAKTHLQQFAPIGVGTNADFYQLNQFRPPWENADFITWSMNPQVHAFDDLSLAETPQAIPAQVESARASFSGKPLIVSPITLKPRFNAVATGPSKPSQHALPPPVDPRQRTLFGAAWTLAALSQLLQSRLDSITLFETMGWLGVIERERGSLNRELFPSHAATPFPLYFVLQWLNEFPGAQIVAAKSSRPHDIAVLVLKHERMRRILCARLSAGPPFHLKLEGLPVSPSARFISLDSANVDLAVADSENYSRRRTPGEPTKLSPHEIVCIDLEE